MRKQKQINRIKNMKSKIALSLVGMAFAMALASFTVSAQSTWTARAPIPTPRSGPASCAFSNKLYVFGGVYELYSSLTNRNEVYDPINNLWATKAPTPQPISSASAVTMQNQILLIGGRVSVPTWYSVATVSSYNPAANTWAPKAPMHTGRDSFVASVVNGVVYAIGGYQLSSDVALNSMESYNPITDTWTTAPSMPTARAGAAGAVIGSKIYVFGGVANGVFLDTVEVFDTATQTWSTKSPMPTPRDAHSAILLNGVVYVTGGGCSTSVDIYFPNDDKWASGPAMPTAGATADLAMAALSSFGSIADTLFISAGEHVDCSGGSYIPGNTIAFTPATIFDIKMYAGLTVIGNVGGTYRIEYKNTLSATNWTTLTNMVLPASPYLFIDSTSPSAQQRFYRAVPTP
jgi:N-acetylneuraminic acid mutarotase